MFPVGAANAAGNDENVPRLFLASADILVLFGAFLLTGFVAPYFRERLITSGLLSASAEWLNPSLSTGDPFPTLGAVSWVLVSMCPATLFLMELLGGYTQIVHQSRSRLVASAVLAPLLALSFLSLAIFALKLSGSSRIVILTFAALSAIGLLGYRTFVRAYKRRRLLSGEYAKNVLLIGNARTVAWMERHFRDRVPPKEFQLVGWLAIATDEAAVDGLQFLGPIQNLGKLLINNPIHEVIAVQSAGTQDWLKKVIEDCDYFQVRLRLVPEALLVGTPRDMQLMFRSEPLGLPEIVLAPRHFDSDALFLKRLIDIVVSTVMLILLSPLFLLIAIAIKTTTPSLPVFYPWKVIGLKGRPFTGYKFTTMVAGAEEQRLQLESRNEMQGPVFKVKNDPRVTPLGIFLRKFSLNELPQFWSVLRGDMSLVGPRPAFRHELERYELWQKRKLSVKPGITCLWQVSGRNRISSFDQWVKLDLDYIDKWSLWLDFKIMVRTVWAVISGSGS